MTEQERNAAHTKTHVGRYALRYFNGYARVTTVEECAASAVLLYRCAARLAEPGAWTRGPGTLEAQTGCTVTMPYHFDGTVELSVMNAAVRYVRIAWAEMFPEENRDFIASWNDKRAELGEVQAVYKRAVDLASEDVLTA